MGDLEVTQLLELANTRHRSADGEATSTWDHDHLATPESARAYLASSGFEVPDGPPTPGQLAALCELRDLSASVLDVPEDRWRSELGRAAARHLFRYDEQGRTVPASPGWDGFIAGFVPPMFELKRQSDRLQRCASPTCRWLFLDRSKNHSRVWCEMASCGSRAKMRRYRDRRATAATARTRSAAGPRRTTSAGDAPA